MKYENRNTFYLQEIWFCLYPYSFKEQLYGLETFGYGSYLSVGAN